MDVVGSRDGERRAGVLLTVARFGHAHWFFGNLYEAIVRMPDRLAAEHDDVRGRRGAGVLAPGSPARYYLPAAPVTVAATLAAAANSRTSGGDRTALAVAAACSTAGAVLTGYLVRTVIVRLLDDGPAITPDERTELVTRWHRVNRVRLVLAGAAAVALERAAR